MSLDINKLKATSVNDFCLRVVFILPLLSMPSFAQAEESAIQILNRMNQALHHLSYTGNLVLLQGNNVSSLLIEHSVVNGVRSERVVRLNETGSEVSRELKGFSLRKIPRIKAEMEKVYSFDLGRENRIANIPCQVITARPKDRERYLQKYCVDLGTGMLLDFSLVGKTHEPVEQFMFTNIEIKVPESLKLTKTSNGKTKAIWDETQSSSLTPLEPVADAQQLEVESILRQISNASLEDGWEIGNLPAGFEISQAPHMEEYIGTDASSKYVTKHYVLTDGLSSMSLFLTPISENMPTQNAIKINSGALNVVTQSKEGHQITAVGEVPELTLKNIVKNLRKKQ